MLKKMRNSLIIMSVLYLILGIIMLIFPTEVSDFICYLVGLMFVFLGVSAVVMYMKEDEKTPFSSFTLVFGILFGAFGVYIVLNPKLLASFIPLVVGVFLIVDSISKLSLSFDLKKIQYKNWWQMMIVAFVILACGIFLLTNPFAVVKVSIMVIGAILIALSISNIFTIYSYSKVS